MGGTHQYDDRDIDGDDRCVDHADRAPDIFRGIKIDPLVAGNSFYLLWMILSFLIVSSVLVVSLGRLGDMYGRVKMYNLGFAIYTLFSLILTITWLNGSAGAIYLVVSGSFKASVQHS